MKCCTYPILCQPFNNDTPTQLFNSIFATFQPLRPYLNISIRPRSVVGVITSQIRVTLTRAFTLCFRFGANNDDHLQSNLVALLTVDHNHPGVNDAGDRTGDDADEVS